jgi:hypothetical protein
VKKFCIVVNFFIWIVIKNYWCDIKSKKSMNVLMWIVVGKNKKVKKSTVNASSTILFCNHAYQTRPISREVPWNVGLLSHLPNPIVGGWIQVG